METQPITLDDTNSVAYKFRALLFWDIEIWMGEKIATPSNELFQCLSEIGYHSNDWPTGFAHFRIPNDLVREFESILMEAGLLQLRIMYKRANRNPRKALDFKLTPRLIRKRAIQNANYCPYCGRYQFDGPCGCCQSARQIRDDLLRAHPRFNVSLEFANGELTSIAKEANTNYLVFVLNDAILGSYGLHARLKIERIVPGYDVPQGTITRQLSRASA